MKLIKVDGASFYCREKTNDDKNVRFVYTENHYRLKKELSGKVIIDIGASIGDFSVLAAKRGAMVYSVEPYSESFKILNKNIKNNCLESQVKTFNVAIGKKGKNILLINNERPDWCSLDSKINVYSDVFEEVKTTTLKELMDNQKIFICDILKLDAEGAELEIAKEIDKGLHNRIKEIVGEFHYWDNIENHIGNRQLEIILKYYDTIERITDYEFRFFHK